MATDKTSNGVNDAVAFSVVIQVLAWLFSGLILDGGAMSALAFHSSVFFWAAVLGSIASARLEGRREATEADVVLLK